MWCKMLFYNVIYSIIEVTSSQTMISHIKKKCYLVDSCKSVFSSFADVQSNWFIALLLFEATQSQRLLWYKLFLEQWCRDWFHCSKPAQPKQSTACVRVKRWRTLNLLKLSQLDRIRPRSVRWSSDRIKRRTVAALGPLTVAFSSPGEPQCFRFARDVV